MSSLLMLAPLKGSNHPRAGAKNALLRVWNLTLSMGEACFQFGRGF